LKVLAFLLAVFAASAAAQEVVTLQTRPGVTLPFFIANMGGHKPEAAALLLIGGGGNIRLHVENGQPRFSSGNFLPRARREFIRNGILPVILDNPTDQQAGDGMSDDFRESAAHVIDIPETAAKQSDGLRAIPPAYWLVAPAFIAIALTGLLTTRRRVRALLAPTWLAVLVSYEVFSALNQIVAR